jgi:hypothetical protein
VRSTEIYDVVVDAETYLAHRVELTGWVLEHGLDPAVIPIGSTIRIAGGHVTVTEFLRNAAGRVYIDRSTDRPAQRQRTVPLMRPFPLQEQP